MAKCKYNRVLLKLSGQSFCKPGKFGIDGSSLESIAERIVEVCKLGLQVAVVENVESLAEKIVRFGSK